MSGRIVTFFREFVFVFSLILITVGIIFMIVGGVFYLAPSLIENQESMMYFVYTWGNWNAYILVAGLILFGIGTYYLYSYEKKKRFMLKGLKIDKRSELLKKHAEMKNTAKRLPKKYQQLLEEKEEQCGIK